MSRRAAGAGSLLLAGLLLGLLGLAGAAAGRQQDPLEVTLRETEAAAGKLKLTVGMDGPAWNGQRLGKESFTVTMNGQPIQVDQATPLGEQQNASRPSVILAVDTSGSMLINNNIDIARNAAANFAGQLGSGMRVGVLSFANRPEVKQELTDDAGAVQAAVRALGVDDRQGDTALYDAVELGAERLAGQPGQRNLVVLSDGRHEGTNTTFQQAAAAARKHKVTIFTVGLQVPGAAQDQAALKRLAEGTKGGAAVSASSQNLVELLGGIGQALASQYQVDLSLPPGLGDEVDFRLRVAAGGEAAELRRERFLLGSKASPATVPVPAEAPPAPALSRLESPEGRYLIVLLGFTTVLMAGLLLFASRPRGGRPYRALRQRLSPYSLTSAIADDQPRLTAFGSSEWAGRATAMAETLVRRGNLEETFLDRLERAGLNMRVAEFVLISIGSAFIPPLLVLVLTRNLLLAAMVVLLGTVAPFLFLAVRASRRQAKFDEQLPATLQLLAGALQAGHSLQQAVDTVVHEAGDPIAGEFQRVLTEARLGRPLEEAFEAMAKRTGSVDFEWTVMAIRLQRQVGGNLAEVLSTVSQTIRERYTLKRQIKALSAEGRLSSMILSILPVLLFAALLTFNPQFLRPLYSTGAGIMMMAGAAVLMAIGVFWLKKITEIKV
jgi:tight adherence protein B